MRIGLFVTCLVDALFPEVGTATVSLLERLGLSLDVPPAQTCCGQMHANTGYRHHAAALAERHAAIFEQYDVVVSPSASCAASVRHQLTGAPRGASGTPSAAAAERARAIAMRTYDLSTFLVDVLGVTDVGAYYPRRVVFHPTCHSLRMLRVGDRPQRLLSAVEGIELLEPDDADSCCGFGGTFATKNPAVSAAMLADKIDAIERTGASVACAADSSCLMHIAGGLSRAGSAVRTAHLAEILASSR
jgi:L-lactate dehydrogenase complex protein LldE